MNSVLLFVAGRMVFCIALLLPCVPVFACDAPVGRFCVDFFRGTELRGKPVAIRQTPFIKYDWKRRSPGGKIGYDRFSARWRGYFDFKGSSYDFHTIVDDGVRILIDGKSILDQWQETSHGQYSVTIEPGAGRHLVEVEYFEAKGNARIDVFWQGNVQESVGQSSAPLSANYPVAPTSPPVAIPEVGTSSAKAKVIAASENAAQAPIGINLSFFTYSSSAVPFKDLIMQSGMVDTVRDGSNDPCPEKPEYDEGGYPKYLPAGCRFRLISVFHILNDKFWPTGVVPYRAGHYVLLFRGKGSLRLSWDASNVKHVGNGRIEFDVLSPSAGIMLELLETDPFDPVRDLHMVHASDEASFRAQPFNETWLKLLQPFSVLRFKDWTQVDASLKVFSGVALTHTANTITLGKDAPANNGEFDNMVAMLQIDDQWPRVTIARYDGNTRTLHLKTPVQQAKSGKQPHVYIYKFLNRDWSDRAKPLTLSQASSKGVAFETMIQLANILDVDPWISVPTAADDHFIEQLAILLKTQLKPNLKAYIEYSNENWNSGFPGYHYAYAKAEEFNLTGASPKSDAWHPYRAIEMFKIFNRVYGEPDLRNDRKNSRLVRILTSQPAWLARSLRVMDWQMPNGAWPTQGKQAHEFADAWAVTTYFGLDSSDIETATTDELFNKQIDSINALYGTADNPGLIRQYVEESRKRGLQLVAYEGGTHLLASGNRDDLVAKLASVNKDERMYGVYTRLIEQWNRLYLEFGPDRIGVWNQLNEISRYDKYGYWGLLQSTYQLPDNAPKYRAFKDWVTK